MRHIHTHVCFWHKLIINGGMNGVGVSHLNGLRNASRKSVPLTALGSLIEFFEAFQEAEAHQKSQRHLSISAQIPWWEISSVLGQMPKVLLCIWGTAHINAQDLLMKPWMALERVTCPTNRSVFGDFSGSSSPGQNNLSSLKFLSPWRYGSLPEEKQGQKEGYLLWKLWVVERGLKNASGED